MKKTFIAGSAMALGLAALAGSGVSAADMSNITTLEEFEHCVGQTVVATCTLGENIALSNLEEIHGDITIDLNGHDITSDSLKSFFQVKESSLTITGSGNLTTDSTENAGLIRVYGSDTTDGNATKVSIDRDVTVDGSNGVVIYNNNGTAYNTTVDIYGTVKGRNSALWVIGTISNTTNYPVINIYDGAKLAGVDGSSEEDGIGVSAMGYAEYNIDAADITGVGAGIGIKAGIFNINGATVTGTETVEVLPPAPYGNGMNPSGAAIQIEGNSGYAGAIELNIKSGRFVSENEYAVFGNKEVGVETEDVFKSFIITSGTFEGDKGALNEEYLELPAERIADGSMIIENTDTKFVVAANTVESDGLTDGQSVIVEKKTALTDEEEGQVADLDIEGLSIAGIFDITVLENGDAVSETDEEITFTIQLSEDLSAPEGYERSWYIIRIHNGVADLIEGEVDESNNTVTFKTKKFSTYALGYVDTEVVISEDEDVETIGAPDTGVFVAEGDSARVADTVMPIVVALIAMVSTATVLKGTSARK